MSQKPKNRIQQAVFVIIALVVVIVCTKGVMTSRNNEALLDLWPQGGQADAQPVSIDQVKAALSNGADVNTKNNTGGTALMEAANAGNSDCVAYLIAQGAEINGKDNTGRTALMQAAYAGSIESIKALLSKGADINAKDNQGATVLMRAAYTGNAACVKFLVANGANVSAKDNTGNPVISYAQDYPDVIAVLKAAGAKE